MKKLQYVLKSRKGQGMVEYGILVGGIASVCLVAVAILGHKSSDLLGAVAEEWAVTAEAGRRRVT